MRSDPVKGHVSEPRRRRVVRRVIVAVVCGLTAAAVALWWYLWPIAVPPPGERRLLLECAESYLSAWQRDDTRVKDLLTSEWSRGKGRPFPEYSGGEVRLHDIFWRPSKPLAQIIAGTAIRPGREQEWKASRIAFPLYEHADKWYFLILVKDDRWLVLAGAGCEMPADRDGKPFRPPPDLVAEKGSGWIVGD